MTIPNINSWRGGGGEGGFGSYAYDSFLGKGREYEFRDRWGLAWHPNGEGGKRRKEGGGEGIHLCKVIPDYTLCNSPENIARDSSLVTRIVLLEVGFNFFVFLFQNSLQFWKNKLNVGLGKVCGVFFHVIHGIFIRVNQNKLEVVERHISTDV